MSEFPRGKDLSPRQRRRAENVSTILSQLTRRVVSEPFPAMSEHFQNPVVERPDTAQLDQTQQPRNRWDSLGYTGDFDDAA